MSCYFRNIKGLLEEAGIEVTSANRKQVDQAIHYIAGTTYKDCPGTWRKLKKVILADPEKRQDFINRLKSRLKYSFQPTQLPQQLQTEIRKHR